MKKRYSFVIAMLLGAGLAFAQTTSGSDTKSTRTTTTGKKATKTSKAHKGGKKSKKGAGDGPCGGTSGCVTPK